jgi:flagellar biosynthesis/type III secretory pathway protein FliH
MATFCGAEAVSPNLPVPPKLGEELLSNLPPPPTEAKDFAQWAQGLIELSEQRVREGEIKGLQAGRREGLQEGEIKGLQAGRRERAADILLVLKTRGVAVPSAIEQRIVACTDPAVLSRWLTRAVTAESAAFVVEPEEPEGVS